MATPVIMPKLEMSQETSTVIEWLKQEGDAVRKGDPLLTVETDKVTVDIESPASGILAGIRVTPQQVVPVTEVIAYILQPGEESVSQRAGELAAPPTSPTPATPVAQRIAAAHGVDLGAVAGTGAGGRITRADVEAVLAAPAVVEPAPGRVRATPAARRIAEERGIALAAVAGTGPQGRVQAGDVLAHREAGRGERTVVPLAGMRRTIAERVTASYQTAPHITLAVRVDMTAFEETRGQLNARAEATGQARVSVTALLVKAVAWALRRHPWLNSTLQDDEIHLLPEVNVGVAVALEEGLIVPVVRQADLKGVAEIAAEASDLAVRAREGRLAPSDVAGGTFTVSNLGPFGVEQFTAIINRSQAAILAVGAIRPEVMADGDGQITVCPVMHMTLSADHRVVDGAVAARFLMDLQEVLEVPALLLW